MLVKGMRAAPVGTDAGQTAVEEWHLLNAALMAGTAIRTINDAAAITPTSGQPDYGPAKAAMINISPGFSKAMSQTGMTGNCVSPGMVRTEAVRDCLANFAAKRGWGDDNAQAEAHVAKGTGQTVKAIGEVEDLAYAVTMLASPRADYIDGANFHVDGGISPAIG